MGKQVSISSKREGATVRVTLALSLRSDSDPSLKFACLFAQEHQARLTLMHVLVGTSQDVVAIDRSPMAIAPRLLLPTLNEGEPLCPLDLTVR